MMYKAALVSVILAIVAFAPLASESDQASVIKAVYHVDQGIDQAAFAMANIRSHLRADPRVHIVVVANGPGVDFLVEGAKDRNGNPFDATVEDLASQGVLFRVCSNTLIAKGITRSQILEQVEVVPSGVAEIARLQSLENYAYVKP
jgi:intracellular sulfur oxidation DsrE/DsrF family protein